MTNEQPEVSVTELKAEARRLRRLRQTPRNLIASLVASLGIVIFLVLVVVRPSGPLTEAMDYRAIAAQSATTVGSTVVVPDLDPSWSSNRAELREENGGFMWRLGLVSTSGDYVQVVQLIGEGTLDRIIPIDGLRGSQSLTGLVGSPVSWEALDRSELEDPGNDVVVIWSNTTTGQIVVRGTSQPGVFSVASAIQDSHPELFEEK